MSLSKGLILAATLVIVILGSLWFFLSQPTQKSPAPNPETSQETTSASGRYLVFSSSTLEETKDKRRVLFFYASWCPTCRPVDIEFSQNSDKLPSDLALIRVNYNDPDTDADEKALAQKYAVTYQHTFVQIDEVGNEVAKWNGGGMTELLSRIKFVQKKAAFAIFTKGTFRVFTLPMYHNLSSDVFIEKAAPNIIKIEKPGITWNDFFSTLPFSLTSDCLTTGTKETFCSGPEGTLKFFLNGVQTTDVLSKEIRSGDKLLVSFGTESDSDLENQQAKVPTP